MSEQPPRYGPKRKVVDMPRRPLTLDGPNSLDSTYAHPSPRKADVTRLPTSSRSKPKPEPSGT